MRGEGRYDGFPLAVRLASGLLSIGVAPSPPTETIYREIFRRAGRYSPFLVGIGTLKQHEPDYIAMPCAVYSAAMLSPMARPLHGAFICPSALLELDAGSESR